MATHPKYLRRDEASIYLFAKFGIGVAPATLAVKACRGGGPVYRKFGRIPVYAPEDLDAWAAERIGEPLRASGVPA